MYATRPSVDATISCGSVPAGTRATIFMLAGSTIAIALSLFSNTSSAADGVCAATDAATPNSSAAAAHSSPTIFSRRGFAVISHSLSTRSSYALFSHKSQRRKKKSVAGSHRSRLLQLQLSVRLVFLKEFPEIFRRIKQPDPLFIIKCDRKTPEPVHAHASLFPDSEIQRSGSPAPRLLFQLRELRFEFFIGWF